MLPKRFWITAGEGESKNSKLEAIDAAFMNAGIGFQNHVTVSSIPPIEEIRPLINKEKGITHVPVNGKNRLLPLSAVIHVVRSLNIGNKGETIACCIALAKIRVELDEKSKECVLAFESQGSSIDDVEENALAGVRRMIELRKAQIQEDWCESGYKLISSSLNIEEQFGCVATFVVFDPFTYEKI